MDQPQAADRRRVTRRRSWWFRLAAVALGLSVFLIAEAVCVLGNWGRATDFDDPFVGFSAVHPLFVLDERGENYEIPKSRRQFFAPDSFPAHKTAGTFRVFCLGGSTVQGRPFSTPTAFTTWLRIALESADPARNWEVVNCGGISYASYRLIPILEECLQHEPDLIVICTGHNEFLEDRTYGHIRASLRWYAPLQENLLRVRTYNLLRAGVLALTGQPVRSSVQDRPVLAAEVDALLDYRGGLAAYHRDSAWRDAVIVHYEYNLRRMTAAVRNAGVPAVLIRPPSNLCDCPPFKSEHGDNLSGDELSEWQTATEHAKAHYRHDVQAAIESLKKAIDVDGQYAVTYYELGKCYEAIGMTKKAREAFLHARDLDICPLRMTQPMEEALADIARETKTPLIDAQTLLEQHCRDGLLGDFLLVDHIHPSFRGHQIIAEALAESVARELGLTLPNDWDAKRSQAYKAHFASLDDMYYLRAQRTLESLRRWTQGRADGPPLSEHRPPVPAAERQGR